METGAYLIQKRRWYQFSIKKKKKTEYEVETLKYKKLEVIQPRIKHKSSRHEVLQL